MKWLKSAFVIAGLAVGICSTGFGQGLFGYYPDDPTEILHKMLGTNFAFSATAHLAYTTATNTFNADMRYVVLDRSIRAEFTISETPDLLFPPENLKRVQHCGVDHTTWIWRPGQYFFLYTNLEACVGLIESNRPEQVQFETRKWEIARETVNGHPCIEYDVLASGGGSFMTALMWEATDLNGFPVRMDWTNGGADWSVRFRDLDFKHPAPESFEVPATYKRFEGFKELIQALCKDAIVQQRK